MKSLQTNGLRICIQTDVEQKAKLALPTSFDGIQA
jgi:hypothetical protein